MYSALYYYLRRKRIGNWGKFARDSEATYRKRRAGAELLVVAADNGEAESVGAAIDAQSFHFALAEEAAARVEARPPDQEALVHNPLDAQQQWRVGSAHQLANDLQEESVNCYE